MRFGSGSDRALRLGMIALLAGGATGCEETGEAATGEPLRIGVATFSHETCTFCPDSTGIAEWEFYGPPVRGDSVLEMGSYIQGFVKGATDYPDVELVGLLSPRDSKGGSSGSWVTREAFDKYTGGIVEDIRQAGDLDGVYLALHGAMAVREIASPEAEIVRRVRAVVGDEVPIMVTLDLHANINHELSDAADAVFIVKQYPHYDAAVQGERAARLMRATIRDRYEPTMATRKPGVLTPSVFQGTGSAPAIQIMERARRWEEQTEDVFVSVAFGFAYADVPTVGATATVITNDDQELADEIAQDMSDYIWSVREQFAGKRLPKTREGVTQALAAVRAGQTPVLVADHSDRTGNSSQILEELIRQGASNFTIATIRDERAIAELRSKAVGDQVSVSVGGWADEYAGNPVRIDGVLEYLGEYRRDTTAVIRFGDNNRVVITPTLNQVTTAGIFEDLGIDLAQQSLISLKSRVHFRRGFVDRPIPLVKAVFEIDAPGLGPADLTGIPYTNIPQDIYPLTQRPTQ